MKRRFTEIYNEVYAKNNEQLETLRKRKLIGVIFFMIAIAFTIVFCIKVGTTNERYLTLIFLALFLEIILFLIYAGKNTKSIYSKIYKENVISELVNGVDSNLNYSPYSGVSESVFRMSKFDRGYDEFSSEDYISGTLESRITVEMSNILTQEWRTTTDSDGNTSRELVTTFSGMFGRIILPELFCTEFEIYKNSKFRQLVANRIEVDSAMFEKIYDCFSIDKVRTMEILSSDIIEKFVELQQNAIKSGVLEMKCTSNMIFFRISNGDVFETHVFRKAIQFDELHKYYKLVEFPIEIAEMFNNRLIELNKSIVLSNKI